MRLDMHSRREILNANVEEYQRTSKKGWTELLDRLVPVTGLNRSYLATVLGKVAAGDRIRQQGTRKERPEGKRGGRPVKYGEEFVKVLSAIWDEFGKPCGKLLVPMIAGMIDFLAESENPRYGITEEMRELLLEVSAAEVDILLKPARKALYIKGISTTRSVQTPLRSQIPVQTHVDRDTLKPASCWRIVPTAGPRSGGATAAYCPCLKNYRKIPLQTGTLPISGRILG